MNTSNRIIFNTGILYARMLITIGISLYSTRLILEALGEIDYGIFNVIAGVVVLLSFISITLSTSTQRHISFSLGKGDLRETKQVFANSFLLHFSLGLIFVLCFELVGLFFIDQILNIGVERIGAAKILFHFVVLTTFFSFISIPLDALNNSYENMLFVAIMSITESVLKLALAIYLTYTFSDKLITYGFLLFLISIAIFIIKLIYCRRKYPEAQANNIKRDSNKAILKQIISFSGWNLIGVASYSARNQGVNIVLNVFFGTVVNTAYGIANQLNGQLSFFSTAMMQALQPRIVKEEGEGNRNQVILLSVLASKYSFILYSILAIPLFIETPILLKIWLKNYPDNTVIFCRLIMILTLLIQLRVGIITSVHAIGKIKKYQLISAPLELLVLPIGYFFLYLGYSPYSILVVSIIIEAFTLIVNIVFFHKMTKYSILDYIKNTILSLSFPFMIISLILTTTYFLCYDMEILRVLLIIVLSTTVYPFLIFKFSLGKDEKEHVFNIFEKIKSKIRKYGNK